MYEHRQLDVFFFLSSFLFSFFVFLSFLSIKVSLCVCVSATAVESVCRM